MSHWPPRDRVSEEPENYRTMRQERVAMRSMAIETQRTLFVAVTPVFLLGFSNSGPGACLLTGLALFVGLTWVGRN